MRWARTQLSTAAVGVAAALFLTGVAAALAQIVGPQSMGRPVRIGEVRSRSGARFELHMYNVREASGRKLICFDAIRTRGNRQLGTSSRCVGPHLSSTDLHSVRWVICRAGSVFFYGLAGRKVHAVDLLLPGGRRAVASRFPIPRAFPVRGSLFAAAVTEPHSALYGTRGHLSGTPYVSALVGLDARGRPVFARSTDPLPFPPGKCFNTG